MKQKWIDAFMDTAERFAQLSSAVRLKVGAVVVKDNRIISIGYNGTPAGWDNACEVETIGEVVLKTGVWGTPYPSYPLEYKTVLKTKDEVIHAEANAILKLARDGESGSGASLFCTHAPCMHCAKLIYGAGIFKVYYKNSYKNTDGLEFLQKCNVVTEKV
jgi:dCMP deaminase